MARTRRAPFWQLRVDLKVMSPLVYGVWLDAFQRPNAHMNALAPSASSKGMSIPGTAETSSGKQKSTHWPAAFASVESGSHVKLICRLWALTPLDSSMTAIKLALATPATSVDAAWILFLSIGFHLLLEQIGQPRFLCFRWSMCTNFAVSSVKYAAEIQPLTMKSTRNLGDDLSKPFLLRKKGRGQSRFVHRFGFYARKSPTVLTTDVAEKN